MIAWRDAAILRALGVALCLLLLLPLALPADGTRSVALLTCSSTGMSITGVSFTTYKAPPWNCASSPTSTRFYPPVLKLQDVTNVSVEVTNSFVQIVTGGVVDGLTVLMVGPVPSNMQRDVASPLLLLSVSANVVLRNVWVALEQVTWNVPAMLMQSKVGSSVSNASLSIQSSQVSLVIPSTSQPESFAMLPPIMALMSVYVRNASLNYSYAHSGGGPYSISWFGTLFVASTIALSDFHVELSESNFTTVIDGSVFALPSRNASQAYTSAFHVVSLCTEGATVYRRWSLRVLGCRLQMNGVPHSKPVTFFAFVLFRWLANGNDWNQIAADGEIHMDSIVANMASHDYAALVQFGGVNVTNSVLLVEHITAALSSSGPGAYYYSMKRETGLLLLDQGVLNATTVTVRHFHVTASSNASCFDDDAVDKSRGATSTVLHFGHARQSTFLIEDGWCSMTIPFGYLSVQEDGGVKFKLGTISAGVMLYDTDVIGSLVDDTNNIISVARVDVVLPGTAIGVSSLAAKLGVHVGLVASHGILIASIGAVDSCVTVENVHVSAGSIITPPLPATISPTPPWPTVFYGLTDCGALAFGSTPRNSVAPDFRRNTIIMRNVTVTFSPSLVAAAWAGIPSAVQPFMQITNNYQLLAISGVHKNSTITLAACRARGATTQDGTYLYTSAVLLFGTPEFPALLMSVAGSIVAPVSTQVSGSTIAITNDTSIVGGVMLRIANAGADSRNQTSHFAVSNSSFVATVPTTTSSFSSSGRRNEAMSALASLTQPRIAAINSTTITPIPLATLRILKSRFNGYASLVGTDVFNWQLMLSSDAASGAVSLRCFYWNDELWSRGTPIGVPSAFSGRKVGQVVDDCDVFSKSNSVSGSAEPPIGLSRKTYVGRGMSEGLIVCAVLASLVQPTVGIGMQRAMSTLQLCTGANDERGGDGSTSGEDTAAIPLLTDSPLQLRIGGSPAGTSYARGTVLGNTVLVAAWTVTAWAGGALMMLRRDSERFRKPKLPSSPPETWRDIIAAKSPSVLALRSAACGGLPGVTVVPLLLLLQPVVSAALSCMIADERGDSDASVTDWCVAVGMVLVWLGIAIHMCYRTTGDRLLCKYAFAAAVRGRRGNHSSSVLIRAVRWMTSKEVEWIAPPTNQGSLFQQQYVAVYEGYRNNRTWFIGVEVVTAVSFGILAVAPFPSSIGCTIATSLNLALSALVALSALLRPYNGVLWNVNYSLNAVLMLLAALLLVLNPNNTTSDRISMVAAWNGVAFAVMDILAAAAVGGIKGVLLRILGLRGFLSQLSHSGDACALQRKLFLTKPLPKGIASLFEAHHIAGVVEAPPQCTATRRRLLEQLISMAARRGTNSFSMTSS